MEQLTVKNTGGIISLFQGAVQNIIQRKMETLFTASSGWGISLLSMAMSFQYLKFLPAIVSTICAVAIPAVIQWRKMRADAKKAEYQKMLELFDWAVKNGYIEQGTSFKDAMQKLKEINEEFDV